MGLQYGHLLIPTQPDFVPKPEQVSTWIERLTSLGGTPSDATLQIGTHSGRVREGFNPLTGEKRSILVRDFVILKGPFEIPLLLSNVQDYDVVISGTGPAHLPPFSLYTKKDSQELEFTESYAYAVRCRLRQNVVSTCFTPPFGTPCPSEPRSGIFHHPNTGIPIDVPNAACARFWIESNFGKWLFPRITQNLNILEPAILREVNDAFLSEFSQGCIMG